MLFKCILFFALAQVVTNDEVRERKRRYLVFTPATQYGTFVTMSIPLPEPNNLVSVAWFMEANYYNVDNVTWFEPLLGDIQELSSNRKKRDNKIIRQKEMVTRRMLYSLIETMMEKHGYPGEPCLLRTICETSTSHYSHNGVLGDLLHLILTPSSSSDEELEDRYYEAEYRGLDNHCRKYKKHCPIGPLEDISMHIDHLL